MRQQFLFILGLFLILGVGGARIATAQNSYPPDVKDDSTDLQALKRVQIVGRVVAIHGGTAELRTDHGQRIIVNLGPSSFWRVRGYRLTPGIDVTVNAWCRNDDGPFFAGSIAGSDFVFELTNDDGFPEWVDPDDCVIGWYPTWGYYQDYWFGPPAHIVTVPNWWHYAPSYWHEQRGDQGERHDNGNRGGSHDEHGSGQGGGDRRGGERGHGH